MKRRVIAVMIMLAMVISLMPVGKAEAATVAYLYNKKKPNTILTDTKNTYIYVGGASINLDYNIGGKTSGVKGTWSSNHPERIKVDKNGVCKAVGNGAAYIYFKYTDPLTKKKASLRVKLKALTRASAITLVPGAGTGVSNGELKMKPNTAASFSAVLTVNPKALAVNPSITTTYGIYYGLYQDPGCTIPANPEVATVSDTGLVQVLRPGVVYLQAIGKNSKNATTYNVYSNTIKIDIAEEISVVQTESTKLKITSPSSDIVSVIVKNPKGVVVTQLSGSPSISTDKRTAIVSVGSYMEGLYTVYVTTLNESAAKEINCEQARIEKLTLTSNNVTLTGETKDGFQIAEAYYKIYDQFGNDVTTDIRYPISQFVPLWSPANTAGAYQEKAELSSQGVIKLYLKNSTIGSTGTLQLIHAYGSAKQVVENVTISLPAAVESIDVAGIYRCSLDSVGVYSYTKVFDENTSSLFAGTTILDSNGLNNFPGAYYLLLRVKDTYGNNVSSQGVTGQRIAVSMSGAGLELAKNESIQPITINGESFLTYPLKAATLRAENMSLTVVGSYSKNAYKFITKAIPAALELKSFTVQTGGTFQTGVMAYLTYSLIDSANNSITRYEDVVKYTVGAGQETSPMITIPDSVIKSSITIGAGQATSSSLFMWEKDMATGQAKLRYYPVGIGADQIVTFPGRSYSSTSINVITQQAQ